MEPIESQVLQWFAAVFPDLTSLQLSELRQSSYEAWDSVAHVTLYAALCETFGLDLDFEAFAEATSVSLVIEQLRSQLDRA